MSFQNYYNHPSSGMLLTNDGSRVTLACSWTEDLGDGPVQRFMNATDKSEVFRINDMITSYLNGTAPEGLTWSGDLAQ